MSIDGHSQNGTALLLFCSAMQFWPSVIGNQQYASTKAELRKVSAENRFRFESLSILVPEMHRK
jgi:hypothetical protein